MPVWFDRNSKDYTLDAFNEALFLLKRFPKIGKKDAIDGAAVLGMLSILERFLRKHLPRWRDDWPTGYGTRPLNGLDAFANLGVCSDTARLAAIREVEAAQEQHRQRVEAADSVLRLPPPRYAPSTDFRTMSVRGKTYSFTTKQAGVVARLFRAWTSGVPDVSDADLLEACGSYGERLRNVFKRSEAWQTVIVPGATKGTHRLAGRPPRRKKS